MKELLFYHNFDTYLIYDYVKEEQSMANTPHYDLPLFETNDIPSWLRDWNSAMTKIDAGINSVAQGMSGFQTDVDNAVNTANSAAGQVTQLSGQVTSLNNRVTALEEGGGGGGGSTPITGEQIIDLIYAQTQVGAIWQACGTNTVSENIETQTISGITAPTDTGAVLTPIYAVDILHNSQSYGKKLTSDSNATIRFTETFAAANLGTLPATTLTLVGNGRFSGNGYYLGNCYYIQVTYRASSESERVTPIVGKGWKSTQGAISLSVSWLKTFGNTSLNAKVN